MSADYKVIFTRRNSLFSMEKEALYELCKDSYLGGDSYSPDKYLIRNNENIEPTDIFSYRSDLVSYTNYVEPLLNIVVGLIYNKLPDRTKVPDYLDYINKSIYKKKPIDLFMQNVAIQSQLYPLAILIDSPRITLPITIAERQAKNLNPYAVIYKYNEIRDFSVDTFGNLQWILLDNTYIDNSNPLTKSTIQVSYTLWTTEEAITFTKVNESNSNYEVSTDKIEHGLGVVPVVLCGFNQLDTDSLQSSPFQNISLSSRKIYNIGSMIDSALFNATFQLLVWPGQAPDNIVTKGYGTVGIAEFAIDASNAPQFIKQGLEDIAPYIIEIKRQTQDIYHQLGFKDPESENIQYDSGKLKAIEFSLKTKNILNNIATELEHTENEIYKIAALYEQQTIDPEIKYNKDYTDKDLSILKAQLDATFRTYPYNMFRREIAKKVAKLTFKEDKDVDIKSIEQDIDNTAIEEVSIITENMEQV
jgi:hypothetical protein